MGFGGGRMMQKDLPRSAVEFGKVSKYLGRPTEEPSVL